MRAIEWARGELAASEALGLDPAHFARACFLARSDPPIAAAIPGVDASGRALVVVHRVDGGVVWRYARRTRALALLTSKQRREFIEAVRAHPDSAQGAAREAREVFARALRDARARDEAATAEARHG